MKIWYWTEQVLIFLAHILLLGWMLYALYEGGVMTTPQILLHFAGIGIYGALLIRISAYLAKRRYEKQS